ncbi:hypothetical protein AAIH32_14350 [Pseudarthrobacter oxydans]|uniref:hypothetical protein n=1 Tax=Pseudarthrobacter oxydans TaxID=1671 RepID=UPI003D2CF12D
MKNTAATKWIKPQAWGHLQPGDHVHVTEASGFTYAAQVETMTPNADIIWVRALGLWTRHLLTNHEGVLVTLA